MADDRKSPLDQALDLLLFAPLGLALTAKDELPKLIDKGRQRTTSQVAVARMIGQFAVTEGQKEIAKRLIRTPPPPTPASPSRVPAETNGSNGNNGPTSGPGADLLAIPGYDSLSASQVVQRLAGLSATELDAVGDYEQKHRGRRTILSKVDQLQSDHS
jgi:hypothetical protein